MPRRKDRQIKTLEDDAIFYGESAPII